MHSFLLIVRSELVRNIYKVSRLFQSSFLSLRNAFPWRNVSNWQNRILAQRFLPARIKAKSYLALPLRVYRSVQGLRNILRTSPRSCTSAIMTHLGEATVKISLLAEFKAREFTLICRDSCPLYTWQGWPSDTYDRIC